MSQTTVMRSVPGLRRSVRTVLLALAQPAVGGQAVIEGVMMRSPRSFAVAVRRPDGSIAVREEAWMSFAERFPVLKRPLLRGANMLIESMANGISALNFSAQAAMADEARGGDAVQTDKSSAKSGDESTASAAAAEHPSGGGAALWLTLATSLGLAVALFKGLPHLLTWGLGEWLGGEGANALPVTSGWFHLVDGAIRLGVFIGYILLISRMPDVRRLFMYHGAEHKSVHAFERKLPLEVSAAREQSTAHPRCGTSLILLVIAVSIFVFAALIPLLPVVSEHQLVQTLFALAVKVPMLLPVAGIAYEAQRLAARHPERWWVRVWIAPGMWMQRLTTREPGDPELEVALTALRKAMWREQQCADNSGDSPASGEGTPERSLHAGELGANVEIFAHFDEVRERLAA